MAYQNEQISKMTTKDTRYYVATASQRRQSHLRPIKTSLRRTKLVSLTQVPVGTSLRCLKLVSFIYVPGRRHKNISNRSAELTYQLCCHDDISAWYRTFKLVIKLGQFLWHNAVHILGVSCGSVSLRYQLVRCYNF